MADLSCERAELLGADVEMGRASQADRVRFEAHLERCLSCRSRTERLSALVGGLREEPSATSPQRDRAIVDRALATAPSQSIMPPARRVALLWVAAAAAVLLSVGVAAAVILDRLEHGDDSVASERQRAAKTREPARPRREAPETGAGVGTAQAPAPAPTSTSTGSRVALAPSRSAPCGGVHVEPSRGSRAFLLGASASACRLALDVGELRVDVEHARAAPLSIVTPAAVVRVVGTVFSVRVTPRGETSVVVQRGVVEMETTRSTVRVPAGREADVARRGGIPAVRTTPPERASTSGGAATGATAPAPTRPAGAEATAPIRDLRELLGRGRSGEARAEAQARAQRPEYAARRGELLTVIAESYALEGDYPRSLRYYAEIWNTEPGTATAANALVAAAGVALDRMHDAPTAVRLYERYLRDHPRGPLREVATIGRCRALGAAGRRDQSAACARAYLQAFPDGRLRDSAEALLR